MKSVLPFEKHFYLIAQDIFQKEVSMDILFFFNSILLGIGLAMDAFSVSLVNGLNEPQMKNSKEIAVAGTYSFFQFAMPLTGWLCVHTIATIFTSFQKFIPWIALILLLYIGIKMIIESFSKKTQEKDEPKKLTLKILLLQGIATSIDALSVGFTIAQFTWILAFAESLIIAATTFIICFAGLKIGKKAGTKLSEKAELIGGIILIAIGLEVFIKGVFF